MNFGRRKYAQKGAVASLAGALPAKKDATSAAKRAYRHQRHGKKPVVALVCLGFAAAIALGRVLAFTDFSQSQTNRFPGSVSADVTLHDEFDGVNKHVFVENTGTSPLYVRVRLDEYMQVGNMPFADGADPSAPNTWAPHLFSGPEGAEDCGQALHGQFHQYYQWNMSGANRPYTPGTPGMVYTQLGPDGKVLLEDTTGGNHSTAGNYEPVLLSDFVRINGQVALGNTPTEDRDVSAWEAINAGCWLLDDTATTAEAGGGWAYWSRPLQAGSATNLLLETVTLREEPLDDWIYRIDVKLQAVTSNDFAAWDMPESDVVGHCTSEGARQLQTWWAPPPPPPESAASVSVAAGTPDTTSQLS